MLRINKFENDNLHINSGDNKEVLSLRRLATVVGFEKSLQEITNLEQKMVDLYREQKSLIDNDNGFYNTLFTHLWKTYGDESPDYRDECWDRETVDEWLIYCFVKTVEAEMYNLNSMFFV